MNVEVLVSWSARTAPERYCIVDVEHATTQAVGDTMYLLRPAAGEQPADGNPKRNAIVCAACGERVIAAHKKLALFPAPQRTSLLKRARAASVAACEGGHWGSAAVGAWLKTIEREAAA